MISFQFYGVRKHFLTPFLICMPFLLILGSCQSKSEEEVIEEEVIKEVQIQKTDSLTIALPFSYRSFASLKIQHYRRNDTDFAMLADIDHSRLLELDLSHARLHRQMEIAQLKGNRYPVFQFFYLSRDSVLIAADATNSLYRHDSLLLIVNHKGEVSHFVNMSESIFLLQGEPKDSAAISWKHQFTPLMGCQNRIFITPAAHFSYGWSGAYKNEHNIPFLCFLDFDEEELNFEVAVSKTPDPLSSDSIYAHEQTLKHLTALSKSEVVVSFNNKPKLYKFDLKEGREISSSGYQSLLEKPKTLVVKKGEVIPSQNYHSTVFKSVVFIEDHNQLLRFADIEQPPHLSRSSRQKLRERRQWMGLYTTDMELLAEGIKPPWFESKGPIPAFRNGELLSIKHNSEGNHAITFYSSKILTKDSVAVNSLRKRLFDFEYREALPLSAYYSSLAIPKDATILLVPRSGCPSCRERSISYFLEHLEEMEQLNVYLGVAVKYEEEMEQWEMKDSRHIIVDVKQNVEEYLNTGVSNPALMKWNGKTITRQLILNPREAEEIALYVTEFAKMPVK